MPIATIAGTVKTKFSRDDKIQGVSLLLIVAVIAITVFLPLMTLFIKSVQNKDGVFVGVC